MKVKGSILARDRILFLIIKKFLIDRNLPNVPNNQSKGQAKGISI